MAKREFSQEQKMAVEAVLFAAADAVEMKQIGGILGLKAETIREICLELSMDYEKRGSGIRMQFMEERIQLITAPEVSSAVEAFLGLESSQKLSRASLEVLTIIAYRQPVSRPAVDAIRGVSSDYVLRSLLNRGLIEEVGRAETPGRPILYGTTQDFLLYFGLSATEDLPPFTPEILETEAEEINILKE